MNNQLTPVEKEAYHTLAVLITALGAGLGVWGITHLLEGCGNDNPAAREQGERQVNLPDPMPSRPRREGTERRGNLYGLFMERYH